MAHDSFTHKFRLFFIGLGLLVLLLIGTGVFMLLYDPSGSNSSDEPSSASNSNSANGSSSSPEQSVKPVEKYKDIGLSMDGAAYRLKFFNDSEYLGACEPEVTKPCEGLYTRYRGRPKAFLSINPIQDKDAARICTGQEKPAFTFTSSAGEAAQACETGFTNRILYYNALLSLSGKKYEVRFTGETRTGVAYSDISSYEEDLAGIFSSITIATP